MNSSKKDAFFIQFSSILKNPKKATSCKYNCAKVTKAKICHFEGSFLTQNMKNMEFFLSAPKQNQNIFFYIFGHFHRLGEIV